MTPNARLRIAITDKNPHVREFLCRELTDLGHWASTLANAGEVLRCLEGEAPPQVLVLDPEAAGTRLSEVAARLEGLAGKVAVVLHVFPDAEPQTGFSEALVVEKQPHMGALKTALAALAAGGKGWLDKGEEA